MPDLTMCKGVGCPRKKTCYRHIAKPDQLQSYFVTPPMEPDGACSYYIEARSKSQVRRLDIQTKD